MCISKYGVCYDLAHSPYWYERDGYVYYFSTAKTRIKFMSEVENHEEAVAKSLAGRFKVGFTCKHLAAIQLYFRTENRGFRIKEISTGKIFKHSREITISCCIEV